MSIAEAARQLDAADPLAGFRERFHIPRDPRDPTGQAPLTYLCGNSLGCMPRSVPAAMARELDAWKDLAVEGHFKDDSSWYEFHAPLREPLARLVGALPREVVAMNSLTVNLHLLMLSFYRPSVKGSDGRFKIIIDRPTFPSDSYAVASQARLHGLDPSDAIVRLTAREGEHTLREEDIEAVLEREGERTSVMLLSGLNFATGQLYDIPPLIRAGQSRGIIVGLDLAHAVGNVPLALHDWGADFAVWCHYKYVNSGPGAVAGAFVHERHLDRPDFEAMARLEGWWGNDPKTRFRMTEEFHPVRAADAWAMSNPPILAMVPLKESLAIFDEAGMERLRAKSITLTGFLERRIREIPSGEVTIITPEDPERRGAQLSLAVDAEDPRAIFEALGPHAVTCDFRPPNIIRIAPTPLYNTFADGERFVGVLAQTLEAR